MENEIGIEHKYHIGYFILSFSIVFVLSFIVLFYLEKEVRSTKIEELQNQEQRIVDIENAFLGREFDMILSDLHYLHHTYGDSLDDPKKYTEITANWSEFSTHRRFYDQIRYIDARGDEKIRINIGEDGAYIVPSADLQNKKDRYYFAEAIKLKEDSVYISPMDLNIENGVIEKPYKPMIRLATPIYDDQDMLKGVIVLNYLAEYSLSEFRDLARNSKGEVILLNANGYRLSSADSENDWNFMYNEKKENTFIKEFPNEWRAIVQNNSQFTSANGLFTATPVMLNQKFVDMRYQSHVENLVFGDSRWYVVSLLKRDSENHRFFEDDIQALLFDVFVKNIVYFILIGIASGIVGFLVYLNRKTYSRIKYYSEYDTLTKAFNRRAGIAKLNELFPTDDRRHFLVSLCFIDINGLKEVNDTLGHKLGDELIKTVSDVIKATIRKNDFLVRLGGDEFLIVFNGIGIEMAENIWDRIVQTYETINHHENRAYLISASHGIVDYDNKQKTQVDDLINAADEKMYHEKQIIKAGLRVIKNTI